MKSLPVVLGAILAVSICGCGERTAKTLGSPFDGESIPIQNASSGAAVVSGTMTEKCPVAGCWFMLQDGSGTIKVDTKNAGFVVVDVPLKTKMTVTGKILTNGNERLLDATGLRY